MKRSDNMGGGDVEKFLVESGDLQESFHIRQVWIKALWKIWVGDVVFLKKAVCFVSKASAFRIPVGIPLFIAFIIADILYGVAKEAGAMVGGILATVTLVPLAKTMNTRKITRKVQEVDQETQEPSFENDRAQGNLLYAAKEPTIEYRSGVLIFFVGGAELFSVHLSQDRYEEYASQIGQFVNKNKAEVP